MLVYLDESGDLGWTFSAPYRQGGSSRFLTLAFLFVPRCKKHLPKRLIRDMYRAYRWDTGKEYKASGLTHNQKTRFSEKVLALVGTQPDISLCAITVKKENVQPHIQADANKLYNYMINLCALKRMAQYPNVDFIRDERSIKIESGNSLTDYLHTELWFKLESKTTLRCTALCSHKTKNLQFVDYVAHCVWRAYEFNDRCYLDILQPVVSVSRLFF